MIEVTPPVALLVGAALLVGVVAVGDAAVPLTPRTVLAAAPWTVAAASVVVAGRAGVYDGNDVVVTAPTLALAVAVLAVGTWVLSVRAAVVRGLPFRERYLAATGSGAAIVVFGALLGHVGSVPAVRLVWLAIVPVAAVLLAALAYFTLGLVYTDPLVVFRFAGLFAVAAVIFDGVATAAAARTLQTAESGVVSRFLSFPLAAVGVDPVSWLLVPLSVLAGVVVVAVCGVLARRRRRAGTACVLVTSVVSLASATIVLSAAVLLG